MIKSFCKLKIFKQNEEKNKTNKKLNNNKKRKIHIHNKKYILIKK